MFFFALKTAQITNEPKKYFLFRSIDRYLKDNGYEWSIIHDDKFKLSRDVLKSKRRTLKADGKGNKPFRADALTPADENKLWELHLMGAHAPLALLRGVWFLTTKLMGTPKLKNKVPLKCKVNVLIYFKHVIILIACCF